MYSSQQFFLLYITKSYIPTKIQKNLINSTKYIKLAFHKVTSLFILCHLLETHIIPSLEKLQIKLWEHASMLKITLYLKNKFDTEFNST